jgi:septal ring factor EnvC (AmiA/AmiB activator)
MMMCCASQDTLAASQQHCAVQGARVEELQSQATAIRGQVTQLSEQLAQLQRTHEQTCAQHADEQVCLH